MNDNNPNNQTNPMGSMGPTNQPMGPAPEPIAQGAPMMGQPMNQPAPEPMGAPEPMVQGAPMMGQPMNQPVPEPMAQPMDTPAPMGQPAPGPMAQPMNPVTPPAPMAPVTPPAPMMGAPMGQPMGQSMPGKKKSKAPLFIGIGAGVAAVIGIIIVLIVFVFNGGEQIISCVQTENQSYMNVTETASFHFKGGKFNNIIDDETDVKITNSTLLNQWDTFTTQIESQFGSYKNKPGVTMTTNEDRANGYYNIKFTFDTTQVSSSVLSAFNLSIAYNLIKDLDIDAALAALNNAGSSSRLQCSIK